MSQYSSEYEQVRDGYPYNRNNNSIIYIFYLIFRLCIANSISDYDAFTSIPASSVIVYCVNIYSLINENINFHISFTQAINNG